MASEVASTMDTTPVSDDSQKSRRRSWFTPGKAVKLEFAVQPPSPETQDEDEVLTLSHFTRGPRIDFGKVLIGKTSQRRLRVHNPNDYEQFVVIEKFPHKKFFTASEEEFVVAPESDLILTFEWNPDTEGSCRETVVFKVDDVYRLQAIFLGSATTPPKPKKTKRTWKSKANPQVLGVLSCNRLTSVTKSSGQKKNCPAVPSKVKALPPKLAPTQKARGLPTVPVKSQSHTVKPPVPSQADKIQSKPGPYVNPQQPAKAGPLMATTGTSKPSPGPVDSPLDPRRTTYGKSSPQMPNTPKIDYGSPESAWIRHQQQIRLAKTRTPSPLAAVKENTPPMLFVDSAPSPMIPRTGSKMRRSNTYTKMNLGDSPSDEAKTSRPHRLHFTPSPASSPTDSLSSAADTTVIECLTADDVGTVVVTEVTETVSEVVETIVTEVKETITLEDGLVVRTDKEETVTKLTEEEMERFRYHDYDGERQSKVNPNFATFVKSPEVKSRILSETCVLSPHKESIHPASITRVLSPDGKSVQRMMSETRVLSPGARYLKPSESHNLMSDTQPSWLNPEDESILSPFRQSLAPLPRTESPRRFFMDLLANKKPGSGGSAANHQNDLFLRVPSPESTRRFSTLTVTKEKPKDEHLVSKNSSVGTCSQKELFAKIQSPESTRRYSSLTVTKEKPSLGVTMDGRSCTQKALFGEICNSKTAGHLTEEKLCTPATNTCSPGKTSLQGSDLDLSPLACPLASCDLKSEATPSPSKSPYKVKIVGANYPFSRSPRQLPYSPPEQIVSPRKKKVSPRKKSRRRSSGRFKRSLVGRRSVPRQLGLVDVGDDESSGSHEDMGTDGSLTMDHATKDGVLDGLPTNCSVASSVMSAISLSDLASGSVADIIPNTSRGSHNETDCGHPASARSESDRNDKPSTTPSTQEAPMTVSDLSNDSLKSVSLHSMTTHPSVAQSGPGRGPGSTKPVSRPASVLPLKPTGRTGKDRDQRPSEKVAPLPSYLKQTSSTSSRRAAVAETKKRGSAAEGQGSRSGRDVSRKEPVHKKAKKEEVAPGPVVSGLTRAQQLRRQAALAGIGKATSETVKAKPKSSLSQNTRPQKKVAQGTLRLIKATTKTALPKHPLAFAAKNVYYDERWMEKQEHGFVKWLNFVLTPHDEYVDPKKQRVDARALFLETITSNCKATASQLAPSKETLSFRLYSAKRRMNCLRRKACKLFSTDLVHIYHKLEIEIESCHMVVRSDRKLHADVGIKQQILDMILSYNPLWLRIGLEAVFGEVVTVHNNADVIGLSRFILTRLLGNPDIAAQFAHPTVPHLYRPGYDKALAQYTLKKFLLLVIFLDHAKMERLIDHDPCLFCKDSEFKASRDILLAFSRNYLSGEGDLTRHLTYMGYTVRHTQTALDEIEYAVTNLAIDLRDGTRLTRVLELLTQKWTLTREMRVPAISRLQKVHNVGVAFRTLEENGVQLDSISGGKIESRDITDGHQQKTLQLLWHIIFNFQVRLLLNEEELKDEVRFLRENRSVQSKLDAARQDDAEAFVIAENRRLSIEPEMYFKSPHLSLLLRWCRAVCAYYNMKVENFTVSFSDGRALCYLVHHYHPTLLPLSDIQTRTTLTHNTNDADSSRELDSDDSFTWTSTFSPTTGKPGVFEELLANERSNFRVLSERVSELGNIPVMIRSSDMSNTIPDEKVVLTYVTYLCARLLDIRQETRAARIIQIAWRRHQLHKQKLVLKERHMAATRIQCCVRDFLTRRRRERLIWAAIKIQAIWRGVLARRIARIRRLDRQMAHKQKAIVRIQALIRSYLVRQRIRRQHIAAILLQSQWRMIQERRSFLKMHTAVVTIQHHLKATMNQRRQRERYISIKSGVIKIQAFVRGYLTRRTLKCHQAACLIQTAWKRHRLAKQHRQIHLAAVTIQSWVRGIQARSRFLKSKRAVVVIQNFVRTCQLRDCQQKQFQMFRNAAVCLQSHYRRRKQQERFRSIKNAAIVIQTAFRAHTTSLRYQRLRHAATVIQVHYRAHTLALHQRSIYQEKRAAVVMLQKHWRGRHARREVRNYRSARSIQSAWRMYQAKQSYTNKRQAVIFLQANIRKTLAQQDFLRMKAAALILQHQYRANKAAKEQREKYLRLHDATVVLQTAYRCHRQRALYLRNRHAATLIQTWWRGIQTCKEYHRLHTAVVIIQKRYRARLAAQRDAAAFTMVKRAVVIVQTAWRCHVIRTKFLQQKAAATVIQSHVRMMLVRRKYCRQLHSAVLIQKWYRRKTAAVRQRNLYQSQKRACLVLQAAGRGWLVRRWFRVVIKLSRAALLIQTNFRGYLARRACDERWQALLTIQRHTQAWLQGRRQFESYHIMRGACLVLQCQVRGLRERRRYQHIRAAAIMIQACYRGYTVRRGLEKQVQAAETIQRHVHAMWRGRQQREEYNRLRHATLKIQSAFRCRRTQQQYKTTVRRVILLQASVRMVLARSRYQKTRSHIVRLQSAARRLIASRAFDRKKQATLVIQRWVKAQQAGCRERKAFLNLKDSAVTIQAAVRGFFIRRYLQRQHCAATVIQAIIRARAARKHFMKVKHAVFVIQTHYRAYRVQKLHRRLFLIQKGAAITIQAAVRGYNVRKTLRLEHHAATVIQSTFRAHRAQQHYLKVRNAVCVLQTRLRAQQQQKSQRKNYLIQKGAAMTIQATFRGHLVRKRLRQQHQAATVIQCMFRAHHAQQHYLKVRNAVCVLQTRLRAQQQQKSQRMNYLIQKGAAMTIQATVRGHLVRKRLRQQHQAATVIQCMFRAHHAQQHYLKVRNAVHVLQTRVRAQQQQKSQRKNYLIQKGATMTIQVTFRGHLVRKRLRQQHRAATVIQCMFRAHHAQQHYLKVRNAVCVLQTRLRAQQQQKSQRKNYLIQKGAAMTIQATVRGHLVRKRLREQHRAATVIQCMFRATLGRRHFIQTRQAVTVIQRHYRACVCQRRVRGIFLLQKRATVQIQAAVRGHQVRKTLRRQRVAATVVQSVLRAQVARRRFVLMKWAAEVLQNRYRARHLVRHERRHFLIMKGAAMTIQAAVRGHIVRRTFQQQHRAATRIQSQIRTYLTEQRYLKLRAAAIILQAHYRAHQSCRIQRRMYLIQKGAAITIQAVYRAYLVRKSQKVRQTAAVVIQSMLRAHWMRKHYLQKREALVKIQNYTRAFLKGKNQRLHFQKQKQSALILQAAYRGHKVRCQVRKQQAAAVIIQSMFRSYLQRMKFSQVCQAVLVLQTAYRAHKKRVKEQGAFIQKRRAVVTIQSALRGYRVRRKLHREVIAATRIQASMRAFMERRRFVRLCHAVKVISTRYTAYRLGVRHRREFLVQKGAVLTIQGAVRGHRVRKELRQQHRAATLIQCVYRSCTVRKRYRQVLSAASFIQTWYCATREARLCQTQFVEKKKAIVILQAAVRGHMTRQLLQRQHYAAVVIQSRFRAYVCKQKYDAIRRAVRIIQTTFQYHRKKQIAVTTYRRTRTATITLQCHIRGFIARRRLRREKSAASMIQASFKAYSVRQQYVTLRTTTIIVQQRWRDKLRTRQAVAYFQSQRRAAVKIQSLYRGWYMRRKICQAHTAATVIQRAFRACQVRLHLHQMRETQHARHRAALCILHHYRNYKRRCIEQERLQQSQERIKRMIKVTRHHLSVVRIQRTFRRYCAMKVAREQVESVIKIQGWIRARLQRIDYLQQRQRIIVLQRKMRACLAKRHSKVIQLQAIIRGWLARRRLQRMHGAATIVQALWRGHKVRKQVKDKKVRLARRRICAATAEASEDKKLGNRTLSALDFLLRYRQLSWVLMALRELDVSTRFSSVCCEMMVSWNAVGIILTLIRSCNRSEAHIDIIKSAINVLLNLAKYEKTAAAVYSEEPSLETLVKLLTVFTRKAGIFTKTCMLLGVLGYDPERRKEIQQNKSFVEKVRSIYNITLRRDTMDHQRTVVKTKIAACRSFSGGPPVSTSLCNRSVLKIRPEWLLRRQSVQPENPLAAVKFMMHSLGIPKK